MSSVKRRIIIEEYVSGGFGMFDDFRRTEIMGLNKSELLIQIIKELERTS